VSKEKKRKELAINILILLFYSLLNLHILPQTKNPTDVRLDVVERVNLF
jgi:hypothetical protein